MQYEEKKHFYQAKGFYISCFLGLFAILCVVAVRNQVLNQEESNQNLVAELGEHTIEEGVENQNNQQIQGKNPTVEEKTATENQRNTGESAVAEVTDSPTITEVPTEQTIVTSVPKSDTSITEKKQAEVKEEETVSVLNPGEKEQGLTWPVNGEILMNYSMDKSVYFATLGQYKVNPAILIQGKEGDKVVSACDCKVTKISERSETGLTLVAEANGYKFIYGQLKDIEVKKGDIVKEGSTIGKLNKPSRYYTEEGCNLYFQVKEDGKSVNPLLFLK
ncbi:MAG: M23 family metallopeptidase [Clostridiales bacterium]|nr:M23 family metallopeptidase [Clostridiales bacterium]